MMKIDLYKSLLTSFIITMKDPDVGVFHFYSVRAIIKL